MNMTRFALKRLVAMTLTIFAAVGQADADPPEVATGKGPSAVVDVRDLGAMGDGKTLCTTAIQNAIDQCEARGGGIVRLPAGIWLTGTVYLESNLTLVLDKDCTLLGSRQHEDYSRPRTSSDTAAKQAPFRYAAILAGTDLQNVTIRGEGTIDGQGDAFRDKSGCCGRDPSHPRGWGGGSPLQGLLLRQSLLALGGKPNSSSGA